MRVTRGRLAVPVLALGLVACSSSQSGAVGTSSATPSPTPALTQPLVAVLDHPFGSVPNTLRLLRPDGAVVAQTTVDPSAEAIAVAGSHLLIAGAGRIWEVDSDGTSAPLPTLPGNAQNDLVRGLVADPNGRRWLWASVTQSGNGVASRIWLASATAPGSPVQVVQRQSTGTALQPVAWTPLGPVVSEEPLGIGGYVLFRRAFGAASLLDLQTRTLRPLTGADCAFSDVAADGTIACVANGREGPHGSGPVTLRITRPGRPEMDVALPASVQQAGAALFSPRGDVLSLGVSPALGEGQERIETDLVSMSTGTRRAVGPEGLMPAAWMPDGDLVAVRLPGVAGGDAGTYVVGPDGTARLISPASTVIGVLR